MSLEELTLFRDPGRAFPLCIKKSGLWFDSVVQPRGNGNLTLLCLDLDLGPWETQRCLWSPLPTERVLLRILIPGPTPSVTYVIILDCT